MKYLNMKTITFLAALSAAQLFANETFGGIGVSIYQTRNGVKVAEIIPGTPAAEGKLQVGDEIIAVDGESLKGKTIEESKASLRGQKNKPLELTFVSGGDTLQTVLRRTQITLRDLEMDGIEAWYGGKLEFDAQEVETYASATENEKQLVAVLQNGTLVNSNAPVVAKALNGVYVERADEFAPKAKPLGVSMSASATLKGLSRSSVSFELHSAGKAVISLVDADGASVASLVCENAKVGFNSFAWNLEKVPSGRYMVTIEHNGSVSGKNVVLK